MIKFIFDLDGTLTTMETLPFIAKHFDMAPQMADLTQKTIQGLIPFEESLQARAHILGTLPVHEVAKLVSTVPLHTKLLNFIVQNKEHCLIATGNIDAWLTEMARILPCPIYCSTAHVEKNRITKLTSILQKEHIVRHWQQQGYTVVFIGDGDNDVQAMLCAHVAIAVSIIHPIAAHVQHAAQYVVQTEDTLYALLCQLLTQALAKHTSI